MIKITDSIYWVGVFNPNMRIFDIVMSTQYGTTYNAYLIKDEKNVLVDTTHSSYCEQFFKNINEILPIEKIDYLVVNHCEPDHAGCVQKITATNPKIKILCSQTSAIFLKKICNQENLNIQVVTDGQEIDIGSKKLKFIIAPFLHWPDTMFTYVEKEKAIFTCDFLGTHYCEPYIFDYKMNAKHVDAYFSEAKNYYNAIFSPFVKDVQFGLNKLKTIDIEYACVSHGPILTKKNKLPTIMHLYDEWSGAKKLECGIPIFYASAYRYTEKLAEAIASGIQEAHTSLKVTLYDVNENTIEEMSKIINASQFFGIGSPTLNRCAVPPIMNLLSTIDGISSANKKAFVFGSYGWSGEAVGQITQYLKSLRITTFNEGLRVKFTPSQDELQKAKQFGADFVSIIKR